MTATVNIYIQRICVFNHGARFIAPWFNYSTCKITLEIKGKAYWYYFCIDLFISSDPSFTLFQLMYSRCPLDHAFFLSINRNLPTTTKGKSNFQKKALTLQNNTEKIAPSGEMSSTVLYVYAWLMNNHILGQPTLLTNQWMKFGRDLAWCQSSAVHVDSMCMWKFTVWACTKHGVSQYAMSGFWNLLLHLEKIPPDETFFLLLGRNVNNESLDP